LRRLARARRIHLQTLQSRVRGFCAGVVDADEEIEGHQVNLQLARERLMEQGLF
jgi:hypothetical protein